MTIRKLLLLSIFCVILAPAATLEVSSRSVLPGEIASVPVILRGSEPVAAFQFAIDYDTAQIEGLSVQTTPDLTAAAKAVTCNTEQGRTACVVVGLNQAVITPDSAVAILVVDTALGFSGSPLELSGLLASDPGGNAVPLDSTPGTMDLGAGPCDLNRDGLSNVLDVQIVVNSTLRAGVCEAE